MSNLKSQIAALLTKSKSLTPNERWLTDFLATQRPSTPVTALVQTAQFRLLASDLTTSLIPSPNTCFPGDVGDATVMERRLARSIPVQVLGIEDMSMSRWEQIEAIEAVERGEGTKGREIIRVITTDEQNNNNDDRPISKGGGPHKLTLQDAAGKNIYGIELKAVEGIGLAMNLGCKLLLTEATVARGVVLMEPTKVVMLGGKIETYHKSWKENRKAELKAAMGTESQR